ncbi:MAG: EF-hand domain-containing protein [Devosiaceae bacterium]
MTNFRTKKMLMLALAGTVLATGFTASAMANDERDGARDRDRGSSFRAGERFARADTDGDRMISLSEFQTGATERFTAMDADGNGQVTPAEMIAERQRASEDRAAQRIARIDTNEDGVLSLEEMTAASEERFARMDRDDDGSLEPRELRRGMRGGERGERDGRRGPGAQAPVEQSL